jgi:acyl-coenzyme A thioesterase PaaI-like protein
LKSLREPSIKRPVARADYAAILDRYSGKGETLAGGVMQPRLASVSGAVCTGDAHVAAAMMHGNRWPALYGGYLFDLADRAARLSARSVLDDGRGVLPVSLEMHFLRAIRRVDVAESDGLPVAWRVRVDAAKHDALLATVEVGRHEAPFVYALATLRADPASTPAREASRAGESASSRAYDTAPTTIVLPAHDANWTPGLIRGRCLEEPGSFAAIADTLLAKAMATVRGEGCAEGVEEHFLVRSLSYYWLAPVDDGPAAFEARVVQRGKRMALAVGELSLDGAPVGRAAGTVVIQRVSRS